MRLVYIKYVPMNIYNFIVVTYTNVYVNIQIYVGLVEVNKMFKDLSEMVQANQPEIEEICKNIDDSHAYTEKGYNDILEANRLQIEGGACTISQNRLEGWEDELHGVWQWTVLQCVCIYVLDSVYMCMGNDCFDCIYMYTNGL